MDERVRSSGYIRIDETPVQVLKSDKASSADHWMWVRVAGPPGQRLILFDYDASRGANVAARLLDGTRGYLQSDGYAVYNGVAAQLQLTHLGCFAHARRRFFEAVQALPRSEQKKTTAAHGCVRRIDALYAIERDIIVASAAQQCIHRVAELAFEEVSAQTAIGFQMTNHRLDGVSTFELALDGCRDAAFGARDPYVE